VGVSRFPSLEAARDSAVFSDTAFSFFFMSYGSVPLGAGCVPPDPASKPKSLPSSKTLTPEDARGLFGRKAAPCAARPRCRELSLASSWTFCVEDVRRCSLLVRPFDAGPKQAEASP